MARIGGSAVIALQNSGVLWYAAQAVGANDGMLVNIDSLINTAEMVADEMPGFADLEYLDKGVETVTPVVSGPLRRSGRIWSFFAQVFGDDTVTGAGPYTHTFNWQADPALFGTMAAELNNSDFFEWPSVKCTGVDITFGGDGFVEFTARLIADSVAFGADATNDGTAFDAVTHITKILKIPNLELELRIDDESAGAMTSADDQKVSEMTLSINRPYEPEMVAQAATDGTEWQTDEPQKSGHDEITLSATYLENTGMGSFDDYDDETTKKARLTWARTVGGTAYSLIIELPSLKALPPEYGIEGVGRLPITRSWRALKAQSTPTGMTNTNPIHMVLQDGNSVTYE